jgi:hypothetical protein
MALKHRQMDLSRRRLLIRRRAGHGDGAILPQRGDSQASDDFQIIPGPVPGMPKLSERLLEIADLFQDADSDEEMFLGVVHMAALAWNYESGGEEMREIITDSMDSIVAKEGMPPEAVAMFLAMVREKHERFPDDRRFIADINVSSAGRNRYLSVISTMPISDDVSTLAAAQG